MKLKDSLIIFFLSIIALVAEFIIYMIFGIGTAFSGDIRSLSGIAVFFVSLMIFTAAVGVLSPICALIGFATKKEKIGNITLIILLSLVVIFLIVFSLNVGKTIKEVSTLEETEETTIESVEEDVGEEKTKEVIQDFYVNERLVIEDFCEFIIHSVEDYKAKSEHMQPKGDFRLIAFDVEVKNISNEEQNYSISNYEAQDSDGYVYESTFYESKEPCFGFGDISSGQTRRGWVTVPVKESAEIVAIIAQPLYKSSPITIKLHKPLKP